MDKELFGQYAALGFLIFLVLYFVSGWVKREYREYKKTCLSCGGPRREGFNPDGRAARDVLCKSCCDDYVAYMSSI